MNLIKRLDQLECLEQLVKKIPHLMRYIILVWDTVPGEKRKMMTDI
jgi:hypothetical protein